MSSFRPLTDVRVLEVSSGWNGAAVTGALMAALGADVSRWPATDAAATDVNHPGLPRLHAGKRELTHPAAAGSGYDVLLGDGVAERALARVGVSPADLAAPDTVLTWVTPYGRGIDTEERASEFTLQAEAGIIDVTGFPDGEGVRAGFPLGAMASACVATTATAAALAARARTGGGPREVDVATFDVLFSCLATQLPSRWLGAEGNPRRGNRHPMAAPWNCYRCDDGWVAICTMSDRQWAALCELLGRPDWAADPGLRNAGARVAQVEAIDAAIDRWAGERSVAEVLETCERAGVAAGPVRSLDEALAASGLRRHGEPGIPAPVHWEPAAAAKPASARERSPGDVEADTTLPLAGLRVVELGSYTSAPLAARLLSGLGAEVTKVEPPHGDPCRRLAAAVAGTGYLFLLNNTDKRSLAVDTESAEGSRELADLLGGADVFLSNLSAATLERAGIGAASLLEARDDLLHCVVTGFDRGSRDAGRLAFDTVIQAMSGIMALTGRPEDPPVRVGISAVDVLGALMTAAQIASWWRWRAVGGSGGSLEVPLHDVGVWACCESWNGASGRTGNRHPATLLQDTFETSDGRLAISVEDAAEAATLGTVTSGAPQDPNGIARALAGWCAQRSTSEAVRGLQEAGLAAAPVNELRVVADHPRAVTRGVLVHGTAGAPAPRLLGYPWWLDGRPRAITFAAPERPGSGYGPRWVEREPAAAGVGGR